MRRAYQDARAPTAIASVEHLTGRTVLAFNERQPHTTPTSPPKSSSSNPRRPSQHERRTPEGTRKRITSPASRGALRLERRRSATGAAGDRGDGARRSAAAAADRWSVRSRPVPGALRRVGALGETSCILRVFVRSELYSPKGLSQQDVHQRGRSTSAVRLLLTDTE